MNLYFRKKAIEEAIRYKNFKNAKSIVNKIYDNNVYQISSENLEKKDWQIVYIDFMFKIYKIYIKIDYKKIQTNKLKKYNFVDDKVNDYYLEIQKENNKVVIYRDGLDYYINIWNETKGYKWKNFKNYKSETLKNWLKINIKSEFDNINNFEMIELYILEQCEELYQYRELYIKEYQVDNDDLPF